MTALLLATALFSCASAQAFTLFGFRTLADIMNGQYWRWSSTVSTCGPAHQPFELTYAVAPNFMANQSPQTIATAKAAVESALQTWSEATNGLITFREAAWDAVQNADPQPPCWEGPGFTEWLADRDFWQGQGFN
ncbi:MAG: hypothetical protein VYC34_01850, partial [Planctomycetota bacterium]|nr:hypothetical protein [Planctomycetota bacterium]